MELGKYKAIFMLFGEKRNLEIELITQTKDAYLFEIGLWRSKVTEQMWIPKSRVYKMEKLF